MIDKQAVRNNANYLRKKGAGDEEAIPANSGDIVFNGQAELIHQIIG